MFKDILKKIANEYKADQTYFGGDVEEDLISPNTLGMKFSTQRCSFGIPGGMTQALYDLGIIEALPAPAEGEVRVRADRAKALLWFVEPWEAPANPSPVVVRNALLLVGINIPLDAIEAQTDLACAETLEWARKAHLNTSNCTIGVPTCPEWIASWRAP
jgi:hypothetical protein